MTSGSARRWFRRVALAVVGLVAAMLVAATPAWAWCEGDPPAPKSPDSGLVGFFVVDPDVDLDTDPGDPFDDPDVSLVETYGYPYHWGTYDLGCGPDMARDPGAIVFTQAANLTFDMGLAMGAFSQTVQDFVYDGPLEFLSGPIETTQQAVFDNIWTVWFPIALMGLGAVVVIRARRAALSENATILLVLAIVLAASTYLLNFPTKAADLADDAVGQAVHTVTTPFDDSPRIEEQMSRAIFYPSWLEGTFGSPDSVVAREYGPELFRSMHYSWTEWQMINDGGASMKERIDTRKGNEFEQIAAELKSRHPGEYRHLIGKESTDRLGVAVMMVFYSGAAAFVVCVGMGLILLAMLIIRAFIIAFPLAGIAGIYPQGRATLTKLWDYLTAAIWCVIKFSFATALFLVITGALLVSDMPGVMKFIVLIVLTVAVMLFARPFRSAKSMLPGLDPDHSYFMGLTRRLTHRRHRHDDEDDDSKRRRTTSVDDEADEPGHERPMPRSAEETLPPLAPPTVTAGHAWHHRNWHAPIGIAAGRVAARPHPPVGAPPMGLPPSTNGSHPPSESAEDAGATPPDQQGIDAAAAFAGNDPRIATGPATHASQPVNGHPTALRPSRPRLDPADNGPSRGWPNPVALPAGSDANHAPADRDPSVPTEGEELVTASAPSAASHEGPHQASEQEVVHGELLEPIYRSGARHHMPSETDLATARAEPILAEPVIDEAGNEVFMIYTRDDRR